jgi:hypothetical protein
MENLCNYSDNWQPYTGDYDKFEYDIKTAAGEVFENCYPNAGMFGKFGTDMLIPEAEVVEIRFSEKPVTELNADVSPCCIPWILSDEGKAQNMYKVNEPEGSMHNPGQRLLGLASMFSALAPMYEMPAMPFDDYNSVPKKHFARGGKVEAIRTEPKTDRNAPCRCGSGKKYKKCCMNA